MIYRKIEILTRTDGYVSSAGTDGYSEQRVGAAIYTRI